MIALLLAAAAPLASLPSEKARFDACVALSRSDAAAAVREAEEWTGRSTGVPARQCLGLALAASERWDAATQAFELAAQGAADSGDGRAGVLWTQAGNAALAANDPTRARNDLDHAVAAAGLSTVMQGEAWLDRARAGVALGDLTAARIDLDKGLKLAGEDPFAWLLSATLARRDKDYARAGHDIEQAAKLAPDDPAIAFEAGNIAAVSGVPGAAEVAWRRAIELGPQTPEGKAAAQALASGAPPALDYKLEPAVGR